MQHMKNLINLDDYFELLSFQSIGADSSYNQETLKCCQWVKTYLEKLGFKVELWEGFGHPTIFAEYKVDPKKPTFLIYNHYDVQPVDPIELWDNPPFEPVLKNGVIYARGAQDNKGQLFYVLSALKFLKERDGTFPINLKLCIEGEEEFGSASLHKALAKHKDKLKADYLAIVDLGMPNKDTPAITLGTRGMATLEMEVYGSNTDLHSGNQGGVVFNPIHALIKMLDAIRDENGKITIPHFYDDVEDVSKESRKNIDFSFDEKKYKKDFDAEPTGGEKGYSPHEREWLRPTIEINGIYGGYTGEGHKSVIPAKAFAKLSCRLVPNQKADKVLQMVKSYLESKAPPGIKVKVKLHEGGGEASRTSTDSKALKAFAKAFSEIFGKECVYIMTGGTISVIPDLIAASGADPVLMGVGLDTDKIHAPNEHFDIDRLEKGAKIMVRGIEILGGK